MPKMHWRPRLRDNPSPIPTPLGASILMPSVLSFCGLQCKILATPLDNGSSDNDDGEHVVERLNNCMRLCNCKINVVQLKIM